MRAQDRVPTDATRSAGALTAAALHALVAFALLSYEPARSALFAAAPIMVELITPPKIEPHPLPAVEMIPPRPKPTPPARPQLKRTEPPAIVAAPLGTPSPAAVSPPPLAPPPPESAPEPLALAPPIFTADYLDNPPPAYPPPSRRVGEQGRVILRVLVNPSGSAEEVQIRTSSGHARLDEAAREAVQHWRFVPAKRGEQPLSAWVLIPISFGLES